MNGISQFALNLVTDALICLDSELKLCFVNASFAKLIGIPEDIRFKIVGLPELGLTNDDFISIARLSLSTYSAIEDKPITLNSTLRNSLQLRANFYPYNENQILSHGSAQNISNNKLVVIFRRYSKV